MKCSWTEFKQHASNDILAGGGKIYRGQANAEWKLETSLHRSGFVNDQPDLDVYSNIVVPFVHEAVEAWTGKSWNLVDPQGLAEFLAFMQHNGFPTPLLDWSQSPYVAAYFAFEAIKPFGHQHGSVAIYSFNANGWAKRYTQANDIKDPNPHVSVLKPRAIGNNKMALQQGLFTWSNVRDIEDHIHQNETEDIKFLTKYEIEVSERAVVMRDLALMGISALHLMPSIESVCKKAFEDVCNLFPLPVAGTSANAASSTKTLESDKGEQQAAQ